MTSSTTMVIRVLDENGDSCPPRLLVTKIGVRAVAWKFDTLSNLASISGGGVIGTTGAKSHIGIDQKPLLEKIAEAPRESILMRDCKLFQRLVDLGHPELAQRLVGCRMTSTRILTAGVQPKTY
ncbi:MAG: hypothetical protein WBD40_24130 [Tepidisphaeraceae bacterium]